MRLRRAGRSRSTARTAAQRCPGLSEEESFVRQGADATMARLARNSLCSCAAPHSSRPLQAGRSGALTRPAGSNALSKHTAGKPDSRLLGRLLIPRIRWGNHARSCRALSRYSYRWCENFQMGVGLALGAIIFRLWSRRIPASLTPVSSRDTCGLGGALSLGAECQRRRKIVPARRRKSVPRARWQLVPVVHGRDPRAGRRALRAAGGGPRVGGACGPTWASGGYSDGRRRRDRLCLSR